MHFLSRSCRATHALAAALGATLRDADLARECCVLSLVGPLGAGKTEFVRGLAAGVGARTDCVASPTFTVAHLYPRREVGGTPLAHFDLYRIRGEDELEAAGFADCLVPGAVVAVEWGERCPAALPRDHLALHFDRLASSQRRLTPQATGPRATAWCAAWRRRLADSGARH